MAIKEHPFLATTTLKGDGVTITYDVTKPNRSDAVGKAYRMNADGKAELVGDGEEFDGKVTHVDDATQYHRCVHVRRACVCRSVIVRNSCKRR